MSADTVKDYANLLAKSIKSKTYDELLECIAENVEVHANVMGKSFDFEGHEKLQKFLQNMPAGISVDVKKIAEKGDYFEVKVSMGIGFMKMPGKWKVVLNSDNKISNLEIN